MKSVTFLFFACSLAAVSESLTKSEQEDRRLIESFPDQLELGDFFLPSRDKFRAPNVHFVGVILQGLHNLYNSNVTLVETKGNTSTIRLAVDFFNLTFSATVRCFYKHDPHVLRYLSTADETFPVSCIPNKSGPESRYNGHSSIQFYNVMVKGWLYVEVNYELGTSKFDQQIDSVSSDGWACKNFPAWLVDYSLVDSIGDFFAVPSNSSKSELIKRVEAKILDGVNSRLNP